MVWPSYWCCVNCIGNEILYNIVIADKIQRRSKKCSNIVTRSIRRRSGTCRWRYICDSIVVNCRHKSEIGGDVRAMVIGTVPGATFRCGMGMPFCFLAVVGIAVMISCSISNFGISNLVFDGAFCAGRLVILDKGGMWRRDVHVVYLQILLRRDVLQQ